MVSESVYKDFAKYYDKETNLTDEDFEVFNQSAHWLYLLKSRCMTIRPTILDFDEVVEQLDKTKSATALFNKVYKNKREVLADPDFNLSFIKYFYDFCTEFTYKSLWLAIQKEEIRPSDKIKEGKFRSIIVGSIYVLIIGQMFYAEIDGLCASNWERFQSGIGMSLFNQNYHKKMYRFSKGPCFGEYDVSQYDSGQKMFLNKLTTEVNFQLLRKKFKGFYEVLGSLAPLAAENGYSDFPIDVKLVMNRLDETICHPVMLPNGDIYSVDEGEFSGNFRTSSGNTDRHKLVEFYSAIKMGFGSIDDWYCSDYNVDETGDDCIGSGPDLEILHNMKKCWNKIGLKAEVVERKKFEDLVYLSSSPSKATTLIGNYIVPRVNTCKIFSSLAFKCGQIRTFDSDISRLTSVKILSHFRLVDRKIIDRVIMEYKHDNPNCMNHPGWHDDYEIDQLYLGTYESTRVPEDVLNLVL